MTACRTVDKQKRTLLIVAVVVLAVAGVIAVRAFRTTTTEIEAVDAVDRLEQALDEDEQGDSSSSADESQPADEADEAADGSDDDPATDDAEASDDSAEPDEAESSEPEPTVASGPVRLPDVGVYPISVTGGEQLDLATGAAREYPPDGFITVTPSGCGVEIRTDFVQERWQSLEWCETDTGLELGEEQIFHQFFGLDDLVVRSCTDSPLSVDATSWTCQSTDSVAERAVTATLTTADVAGEERSVLVVVTSLVLGDHPDNIETIELWVDVETGLPVRETRTYDFTLVTPLGDAGYTEAYEWSVTSLVPLG